MFEIGLNVGSGKFDKDRFEMLQRGRDAGVIGYLFTGTSFNDVVKTERITRESGENCYFTSGIHPHNASSWGKVKDDIGKYAMNDLCKAVGECGLDYDRMFSSEQDQLDCLTGHMELALKTGKPLFLHLRGKDNDLASEKKVLAQFKEIYLPYKDKGVNGVVHCFTMGGRSMEALKSLGLYFGLTGWICDERRGKSLQDVVRFIPNDKLMIETDAPYLTPPEARSMLPVKGRNEPMFLRFVLEKIAKIKNKDPDQLNDIFNENVRALFKI